MPEWITRYWVEWLFGIVAALAAASYRRVSKHMHHARKQDKALDDGMRALLREYRQKLPRCKWLGWDMKPLGKWEYEPPTLLDVPTIIQDRGWLSTDTPYNSGWSYSGFRPCGFPRPCPVKSSRQIPRPRCTW